MTNVTYYTDIPAGPNAPKNDQPLMKQNTNGVNQILAVEHYSFNDANGGLHQKMTMPSPVAAGVQTGTSSCVNSVSNSNTGKPESTFTNERGAFTLSGLRAIGSFIMTAGNGVKTAIIGMNVTSITRTGGNVVIVLPAGVVQGTANVGVFIDSRNGTGVFTFTWSFTANTLTITFAGAITNPPTISFQIWQL